MVAKRVDMHRLQELVRLHRLGQSARDIARMLGMGRNSVRRYLAALAAEGLLEGAVEVAADLDAIKTAITRHVARPDPPQQQSSIESYAGVVEEMLRRGAGPRSIYDCLKLRDATFKGSLSAVKRLCWRIAGEKGVKAEDVAIPVETAAGEVAQVDFGYVGRLYDATRGGYRRAWVFVMTLGHSRHIFADIVFDQRTSTWLKLHMRAFATFGGVPKVIVPDNLKAAVIRAAFSVDGPTALNRAYCELARHYGFRVDPAPPRAPKKKGKVEANMKYVKTNFFKPRGECELEAMRQELRGWVLEVAGQRVHGTTGRRPLDVFESEEKLALLPLPIRPFEMVIWAKARVHPDSHVIFERCLYSVPWTHIGHREWVRATDTTLAIYCENQRIATHSRSATAHRLTQEEHLPEHRRDLRHRSREHWQERADALGEEVGRHVREVFDSDDVLLNLRAVQAIVTYLKQFPPARANAACARARAFGNYTYKGIKKILQNGLDLESLETGATKSVPLASRPRFARSPSELVLPNLEETHECQR